jgi:hypothetical protein
MINVNLGVNDGKLAISVDLTEEHGRSKSGKTIVIGSTQGNKQVEHDGEIYYVGVNVYKYPK